MWPLKNYNFSRGRASQDCSFRAAVLDKQYMDGALTSSATSVKAAISLVSSTPTATVYSLGLM